MLHSKLIITDSAGVQEEAATLGIPVSEYLREIRGGRSGYISVGWARP